MLFYLSGRQDSNLRQPVRKLSTLPACVTSRKGIQIQGNLTRQQRFYIFFIENAFTHIFLYSSTYHTSKEVQ